MLVLSRQNSEQIYLYVGDERITVTVVRVDGDKVRLGFDAPDHVKILRSEVKRRQRKRTNPGPRHLRTGCSGAGVG